MSTHARFAVLTVLSAAGLSVWAASPPAAATISARTGPRALFEKADVDAGSAARGTDVEAVFEVRNIGDEPLKILAVRPG
jgi:hypothetical protein